MRRRASVWVVPLVWLLLVVTGCTEPELDQAPQVEPGALKQVEPGAWGRLADVPLTPREGPVVATVGHQVVVAGGYDGPLCPPNADCERPRSGLRADGARYDPEVGTWSPITEAPLAFGDRPPFAVVGDDLFVLVDTALLRWSSEQDAWDVVESPDLEQWSALVADGERLLVVSGSDEEGVRPDRSYDPATGVWSVLPENPLAPAFDRSVVSTPEGVVLVAKQLTPSGEVRDPSYVSAALLAPGASRWRSLPATTDVLGGGAWHWTGDRLVDVALGGADGGEVNNYGRTIPYGGRLDPATGTWSALPDAPAEGRGGWTVEAASGALAAGSGWLYDDAAEEWIRLERPEGAPSSPGPAAWLDGALVVVGGLTWEELSGESVPEPDEVRSTTVWAWRAP